MLIKDENFRNLYHSLIILKEKKYAQHTSKLLMKSFTDNSINSMLMYPYIDHDRGMLFLALGMAKLYNNKAELINRDDFNINKVFKKCDLNDKEFKYLNEVNINDDFKLTHHRNHARHITKKYSKNLNHECIRDIKSLDKFRDVNNPDDISVLFIKDKLRPERLNVRLECISDGFFKGILLNNPKQNFGVLKDEDVDVYLRKNEKNSLICYCKL